MKLSAALHSYLFSKDFTPRSLEWYESQLTAWSHWLAGHTCPVHEQPISELEQVSIHHVREYLAYLKTAPSGRHDKAPISSQTLHGYARAIKAFLRWAVNEELLPPSLLKRFEMPKREQKVIAVFTREQIAQLLSACMGAYEPRYYWLAERDRAILMVLLDTGIRASELCGLTLDAVHIDKQDAYLVVDGKGRKQREVGLGVKCRNQLYRYIHRFRPQGIELLGGGGHDSGNPGQRCHDTHVFLTRDKRGLETHGLEVVLRHLKQHTGITGVRCSAHDFRHTFAYNYVANGGDVLRLSRILGHTDLAVTAGYLRAFDSREARKGQSVLDNL